MADVTIVYGSMGFEKVSSELLELMKTSQTVSKGFAPISEEAVKHANETHSAWSKIKGIFGEIEDHVGSTAKSFLQLGGILTGVAAAITGIAVGAFTMFTKSVVTSTDEIRKLEIGLYGLTKSWDAVAKIEEWSERYAEKFAVTNEQILGVMTQLGRLPVLKPMLIQADVARMKELADIVMGLSTMRPEAGIEAAANALRMALMGRTRGLEMGYGIPMAALAVAAGPAVTPRELRKNAEEMINALKVYVQQNVGVEALRAMTETISGQMLKLHERYEDWLRTIGKTGPYRAVVGALADLNEWLSKIMLTEKFVAFTTAIAEFMDSVISGVKRVLTVGVDWDKVTNIEGALVAFRQIVKNATEALKEGWDVIKEPITAILVEMFGAVAKAGVAVVYDLFIPIGKSIIKGIIEGLRVAAKENPVLTAIMGLVGGGIAGTLVAGPGWGTLGGAAVGGLGLLLPALIDVFRGVKKDIVDGVKTGQAEVSESMKKWLVPVGPAAVTPAAVAAVAVKPAWTTTLEQQFGMYGAWSRMAGVMAKIPEAAPETATFQFATGKISLEQLQALRKIEDFQSIQMGKLDEVRVAAEKVEGISPDKFGTLAKVYSEMFNIAVQKGDFSKAQDLMNKSLDAMRDQLKASSELGKEELEAAKNTSLNSTKMEDHLKIIRDSMGKFISLAPPKEGEKPSIYQGPSQGGTMRFSDVPFYDEVVRDVVEGQVE